MALDIEKQTVNSIKIVKQSQASVESLQESLAYEQIA